MKSYVIQVNNRCHVWGFGDGFNVDAPGFYVVFTNDVQAVVDLSGPWDDLGDAEMAARRAEELAR